MATRDQIWFCSVNSTQDVMLRVTEGCKLALDGNALINIMFIDFSKAITHYCLLNCLKLGILVILLNQNLGNALHTTI